jgi:ABC-type uncharacterized transport system YnjBCD ATPase subunit
MAENGQKRDPSSHRTPGQITRMNKTYDSQPDKIKGRAERNAARAMLAKEGLVKKGDGKDVDHKKPVRSGGTNARSNLRVLPESVNRAWRSKK